MKSVKFVVEQIKAIHFKRLADFNNRKAQHFHFVYKVSQNLFNISVCIWSSSSVHWIKQSLVSSLGYQLKSIKMSLKCNLFVIFITIGLSSAASSINDIPTEKGGAKAKCENSYSLMCLKLDILNLIDKISTTNTEFNIASGITLVRENNPDKALNSKIVSGKQWKVFIFNINDDEILFQ